MMGANPWAIGHDPTVTASTQDPFIAGLSSQVQGLGSDVSQGLGAAQSAQMNLGNLQSQFSSMQGMDTQGQAYPSFPNAGGFGSQNPYAASTPPPAASTPAAMPMMNASPTPTSSSFNPWSLQGEAMSR